MNISNEKALELLRNNLFPRICERYVRAPHAGDRMPAYGTIVTERVLYHRLEIIGLIEFVTSTDNYWVLNEAGAEYYKLSKV